jgi:hypothetical protein
MASMQSRAGGTCAAAILALSLGCNAFDDRPTGAALPRSPGAGFATTPDRAIDTPPPVMDTSPGIPLEECLDRAGLGAFGVDCVSCICETDIIAVLECDGMCLNLIGCVFELCGGDGNDLSCIVERCSNFLNGANTATALGNVLQGPCDGVCRREPEPEPPTGCIDDGAPASPDADGGTDGGTDCFEIRLE